MSNINPASINAINEAAPLIEAGYQLCKKPNKTPEEIVAAQSFKKTMKMAISAGVITLITITIATCMFILSTEGRMEGKRTGTVMVDGTVRYIQNGEQYISLEELGLSNKNLTKGDKIIISFDYKDDKIQFASPEAELEKENKQTMILFLTIVIGVIVYDVGVAVIGQKTYGKPFRQYYSNLQYKQSLKHKL